VGGIVALQTLRALRAHDDTFAAEFDAARLGLAQPDSAGPQLLRAIADLPEAYWHLLDHVVLWLLRSSSSSWWDGYAAATRYRARFGHLDMNCRHIDPEGYAVGPWAQY
jgi:hypothetical protein